MDTKGHVVYRAGSLVIVTEIQVVFLKLSQSSVYKYSLKKKPTPYICKTIRRNGFLYELPAVWDVRVKSHVLHTLALVFLGRFDFSCLKKNMLGSSVIWGSRILRDARLCQI